MHHGNVSEEIAQGLLVLRQRIAAAKIPPSQLDESINIATWNIRELGRTRRSEAAVHYLAEIIGQFDLVGVVELRQSLVDVRRVLEYLGPYWRVVYSDVIPDPAGNQERIAYLYDKRAVVFNGLAAEATPPRAKRGEVYATDFSWWRAPYLASFRAGNFDFIALTAHIQWGTTAEREKELAQLAEWIELKRVEKDGEDRDWIVMGDFNIADTKGRHFQAITKHGLQVPAALRDRSDLGSNLAKNKRYDQILHHPIYPETFTNRGGVLDFHLSDEHIGELFPELAARKEAYTRQLSDHLPLWLQVRTDIDGFRLEQLAHGD